MSKVKNVFAAIFLALNTILALLLGWTQFAIAAEGRRNGLDEHPPVIFFMFIASIVAACAYALFTRRYGAAIVGGASMALLLMYACLMVVGGVGM